MNDAPARAGGGRRRVDWRLAAQLLGQGIAVDETAQRLGCAVSTLKRRLAKDPAFRDAVARYGTAALAEDQRLPALRRQLHQAIENEVRKGNVRVIIWLADRMKLIEPEKARSAEDELGHLIDEMSPDELIEFEGLRDPA